MTTYPRADRVTTADALLETTTGANRVISTDHSSIHNGEGFNAWVYAEDIADDAYAQIEFSTSGAGQNVVHMKMASAWSEGGVAVFSAVEAPTLTTGSNAFIPVNLNRRGTPPESVCTLKTNPTDISGGTTIRSYYLGGGGVGQGAGGALDKDIELVLKADTVYLFRVQNLAGATKALSLWLFWYEEPYV